MKKLKGHNYSLEFVKDDRDFPNTILVIVANIFSYHTSKTKAILSAIEVLNQRRKEMREDLVELQDELLKTLKEESEDMS